MSVLLVKNLHTTTTKPFSPKQVVVLRNETWQKAFDMSIKRVIVIALHSSNSTIVSGTWIMDF